MLIFALLLINRARHAVLLTKRTHAITGIQPKFSALSPSTHHRSLSKVYLALNPISKERYNMYYLYEGWMKIMLTSYRIDILDLRRVQWSQNNYLICRVLNCGIIIIINKNKYIVLHKLYVILRDWDTYDILLFRSF